MPSFTALTTLIALSSLSIISAAPIDSRSTTVAAAVEERGVPAGWATGYLEDYDVYHTRYVALSCQTKHNTTFFDDCCHPLLSSENLQDDRDAKCTPSASASVSASEVEATETATAGSEDEDEYCSESASIASVVSSLVAEATGSVSVVYLTTESETQTLNVAKQIATDVASTSSTAEYVAPSTTSSTTTTAAATSTAASSSGGGETYTGEATYFWQNGNPGACGNYNSDSAHIVAIDAAGFWQDYASNGNSPYCGKSLTITNTNNGKSIQATVADVCPTCVSDGSLDLSWGAFTALGATADEGTFPISWSFN